MILVLQNWRKIPARVIRNVSDAWFDGDDFVWRIGRSKKVHRMDADRMESEYTFAYLMGEDTILYGTESYLKWLIWKNFWVADLDDPEFARHVQRNPI